MSTGRRQAPRLYPGAFGGEDEDSLLQQFSVCPSCLSHFGLALILPCSHPMCAHCVEEAAAAAAGRARSKAGLCPGLNACSVPCSCCRGNVELPCQSWSSAVSCLPEYPNLSSGRTREERGSLPRRDEQVMFRQHETSTSTKADGAVNLQDEDMERAVRGLHFTLDSSMVPPSICLSCSSLTATYQARNPPRPAGSDVSERRMIELRGNVQIRCGQYYWEVDVCNSALCRIGVCSLDGSHGWWLERRGSHFAAVYDATEEPIYSAPPGIKTIGLFLNTNGGALSFFSALSQEHLVTLPTRFDRGPVVPAFGLGQGRLKVRTGLAPPQMVFRSKDSRYSAGRRSEGAGWRTGVAFGSVRKAVEKFEELALSQ